MLAVSPHACVRQPYWHSDSRLYMYMAFLLRKLLRNKTFLAGFNKWEMFSYIFYVGRYFLHGYNWRNYYGKYPWVDLLQYIKNIQIPYWRFRDLYQAVKCRCCHTIPVEWMTTWRMNEYGHAYSKEIGDNKLLVQITRLIDLPIWIEIRTYIHIIYIIIYS